MTTTQEETYGPYGGRYVPETLIPALDELTAAWEEARTRPHLPRGARELGRNYTGRPSPLTLVDPLCTREAPLPQAGGSESHGRAQDQQRPRPGRPRAAPRQEADHRRDGRRPARCRHRHRLRALRARVRRLHGRRGHAPPGAERRADAADGRDRRAGRVRHRGRSRRQRAPPSATGSRTSRRRTT